jgi:hypothetical protein
VKTALSMLVFLALIAHFPTDPLLPPNPVRDLRSSRPDFAPGLYNHFPNDPVCPIGEECSAAVEDEAPL